MKKTKIAFLSIAFFIGLHTHAQITNPAPYCSGQYDDGETTHIVVSHYISNVSIGTLNNFSGDTQYAFPHYVYYDKVLAPELIVDSTYTLSVLHDPDTSALWGTPNTMRWVAVYIDFNRNNIFDSDELVLSQVPGLTVHLTNPTIATVTIPSTAQYGITRMRVMVTEDTETPMPTPCTANATGYMNWGETIDYNVIIVSGGKLISEYIQTDPKVYPNPTTNYTHIDDQFIGMDMSLTDMQGKVVKRKKITSNQIDVSILPSGQYIMKVMGRDGVYTQCLSIEKK